MERYILRHLFLAVFGGILLGSWFLPVGVQAADTGTIRVGYYQMDGFMSVDETGNLTGYNMEFLNRIAAITGWSYDFVEVSDVEEGLKLLERHEIDLMAPCQLTQIAMRKYEYCADSFGTQYAVLVTHKDNETLSYEDFDNFHDIWVGVASNDSLISGFMAYRREKGFDTYLRYMNTQQEALAALSEGKLDAAAVSLMTAGDDYKILARFAPEPFYYATWSGNTELMSRLNSALSNLKSSYPGLENELMEEYFPLYDAQYISKKEEEYIDSLRVLRVGYVTNQAPVAFENEFQEFDGISRKIFERIMQISGLRFEYVPLPVGDISLEYLTESKLDLLTNVEYNSVNLHTGGIQLSNVYFSSRKVIVADKNTVFDKEKQMTVAMCAGSQTLQTVLKTAYPNFGFLLYDTLEDAFDAVRIGEADLLIQNQYMVEDWLSRPKYENLQMLPIQALEDNLCFAALVGKDGKALAEDIDATLLLGIINKALTQISQDEINTIVLQSSMDNRHTYTFEDFFYRYRATILITGILLLFVGVIVAYAMRLRRRAKRRQEKERKKLVLQQKRYQIIMDESDEMIYEINLSGGDNTVSDRIMEKFGWTIPESVQEIDADTFVRIFHVHADDASKMSRVLHDMEENNGSCEYLVRLFQIKGSVYIWCKVTCISLLDEENRPVFIVGKILDVDAEIREKERLKQQSRLDGLTGLVNKKTFHEEVSAWLAANTAKGVGIIFVDLDHFKDVNDKLGHSVGDQAIQEAAKKLQRIFADFDLVARFGGDEFCLFVKVIDEVKFEKKLSGAVLRMRSNYTDGKTQVKVTASIGAAFCTMQHVEYKTLLDVADDALYEAKRAGRNRYVFRKKSA